jgi:hypothetical protein
MMLASLSSHVGGRCATVFDFLRHGLQHYRALGWPVGLALGLGVPLASFLLGVAVVIGLPSDFFVRTPGRRSLGQSQRALGLALHVAKNLLGVLVFVVGFIMALPLVPGPGVLFMLVGLGLVDFPGKRSMELRLLREPHVLASVNKMRARFGKPPILTEDHRMCPS